MLDSNALISTVANDIDSLAQVTHVIAQINRYRYRVGNEIALQDGLATALTQSNIAFEREVSLSERDRPDFVLENGLLIEVKIKGSFAQLLRQCARYAKHDCVKAILVAGTPFWIPTLPAEVSGKPLYHLRLIGSLL